MKNGYTQLTEAERYHIYTMLKQKYSLRQIAAGMGRSHTTISREVRRNTGKKGYRYKQAHLLAGQRHQNKRKAVKLTPDLTPYIENQLKARWSPEQICGRLRRQGVSLNPQTIYRLIEKDKRAGGSLHRHLRHYKQRRRKRYGSRDYRGKIPHRVDISARPAVVDKRSRVGDWETDLMMGRSHRGAIVTLAERRTRICLALPIARKTQHLTTQAICTLLKNYKCHVHTITYDNGREFSGHQKIAKVLQCDNYFARPYHSWERGLNENTNGLLRQYFPKGQALDKLSEEEVWAAVNAMNNRPRKCLGFKTPLEVFAELTQDNTILETSGALME